MFKCPPAADPLEPLVGALRSLRPREAESMLLSTTQAAAVLGVSVRTLQRRVGRGEVPRLTLAGHPIYRLADLDDCRTQ